MNNKEVWRSVALTVAGVVLIAGVGIAGHGIGSRTATNEAMGQQTGYQAMNVSACNILLADHNEAYVRSKGNPVSGYRRKHLYAADLSCTNDQIERFNALAQKRGGTVRVCRNDSYAVTMVVNTDEPMSCATIARQD